MQKFAFFIMAVLVFTACGQQSNKQSKTDAEGIQSEVVVYYFHGAQRCRSCQAIEQVARKVVAENYTDPNQVQFVEVDISKKEFSDIVEKYEVAWSSLIIEKGVLYTNMTDKGFAMGLNNPDGLYAAIQEEITRFLAD